MSRRSFVGVAVMTIITAVQGEARQAVPRPTPLPPSDATLPAEFTLITGVRELSDGRLLVTDGSEKRLVVADWAKGTVTQMGRNGSGPDEYLQPSTLLAIGGDSTIMPDAPNGRWLVLNGAAIARTIGPDAAVIQSGGRLPLGADDRGSVVFTKSIPASGNVASLMPRGDSVLLLRVARATGRPDTVAVLRMRPTTITIQGPADKPTSVSVVTNPLATGELATLFSDGWIAIARLEPYRIEWIASDGTRTRGAPLPFERVRLDEREQRAFLERQSAQTGRPPRDPASLMNWPETMPPFLQGALLRAPDGRLWIRRTATAGQPHPPYDVVDRRGVLVARIATEPGVTVVGFGRGVVYTAMTDDDGIQHLQRRRFP
jgi:hypothetical protein